MKAISMLALGTLANLIAHLAEIVSALPVFLLTFGGPVPDDGGPARLLRSADLVHQGSFLMPDALDTGGRGAFEFTNGTIAFNPANQSLFVAGHDHGQQVAEINIPALGGRATVRQGFRDVLEGRMGQINPNDPNAKKIGGMTVIGDNLVLSAFSYYDGGGTAVASHFVRSVNLAASGSLRGPFRVGNNGDYNGAYAGYFTPIPPDWQAALGGTLLNGACCRAIVSLWSYGPSIAVVNPVDLVAARHPTPAVRLLNYPQANPLGGYESQGPLYNGTTEMGGAVLPAGTRTLLFIGRQGLGPFSYQSGGGPQAPPYQPHVWAYDVGELAAVRLGAKQPWDVRPYATWRLAPGLEASIGGVAVDPDTGRIFVAENLGEGTKLRINVFTIRSAPAASTTAIIHPSAASAVRSPRPSVWRSLGTPPSLLTRPGPAAPVRVQGKARNDFNGDGHGDLLWQHADGSLYVWLMQGNRRAQGTYLSPARVDPAWRTAGAADFDGDGDSDILWRHRTGALHMWLMDGAMARSEVWPIPNAVDSAWRVAATADFNGDRKADIVWQQEETGALQIWFMDGSIRTGAASLAVEVPTGTRVAGAADFNGDGHTDLLWRDPAGSLSAWFMRGVSVVGGESVPAGHRDARWRVAALIDLNNDRHPDLVWQNDTTGELSVWLLQGTRLVRIDGLLPRQVESSWRMVGGS